MLIYVNRKAVEVEEWEWAKGMLYFLHNFSINVKLKNNLLEKKATDLEKMFLVHLSDKKLKSINLNSITNN